MAMNLENLEEKIKDSNERLRILKTIKKHMAKHDLREIFEDDFKLQEFLKEDLGNDYIASDEEADISEYMKTSKGSDKDLMAMNLEEEKKNTDERKTKDKDSAATFMVDFNSNMTNEDIINVFKKQIKMCQKSPFNTVIYQAITSEFDNDQREIYQIPEGKALFKRIVDMGWFGLTAFPASIGKKTAANADVTAEHKKFFMDMFVGPATIAYCDDNGMMSKEHLQEIMKKSMAAFNEHLQM